MTDINVLELYFLPPLAIARIGGSDTPLECFHWVTDTGIYAASQTTIAPQPTITVDKEGTPSVYLPKEIRFRDAGKLRPVAPFFELWMRIQKPGQKVKERPVTLGLLERLGIDLSELRFSITVGNKKAQRRTQSASCSFIARVDTRGDEFAPKPLRAFSPSDPDHVPLVREDAPVPLGSFQLVRPVPTQSHGVDLSVVRVRYTPGKGEVYGPPKAIASVSSPLPEGEDLPWTKVMQGRMHEIVKPENRILNGDSEWNKYGSWRRDNFDALPYDSYDGAALGTETSWGVVDDTCDGVLECHLAVRGNRFSAYARVAASMPDYSPDRRPFVSVADDFADRCLGEAPENQEKTGNTDKEIGDLEDDIADLFDRIFETASQINLDAERYKFVGSGGQNDDSKPPHTDFRSMTKDDAPDYARNSAIPDLIDQEQATKGVGIPRSKLQYTDLTWQVHARLTDTYTLLDFLRTEATRIRKLVRPPFARFNQLKEAPAETPDPTFRDPRVSRSYLFDMRMPPYMRDSDMAPLALSWRQYETLMRLLDLLAPTAKGAPSPMQSRINRHVDEVLANAAGTRGEPNGKA